MLYYKSIDLKPCFIYNLTVKRKSFTGDNVDNLTRLNLLYDFYGDFLTKKQREIFELYFLNDLSLGEIAEQYGITRQGVYDIVKRSQDILENYKKKLGMAQMFFNFENKINAILKGLKAIEPTISSQYKDIYRKVMDDLISLLKEGG